MKKFILLILFCLVGGITACDCGGNPAPDSSSSTTNEKKWDEELEQLMITHLGETIPFINLTNGYLFAYDEIYKEVVIRDKSGHDFSKNYKTILINNDYILSDPSTNFYTKNNIYIEFIFDSWNLEFTIYAGTIPVNNETWNSELQEIMTDNYGVVIPATFTNKVSYYYDETEKILTIHDPFSSLTNYFETLLLSGYTYMDSDFVYDYLYIDCPLDNEMIVIVAVSFTGPTILMGLDSLPQKINAWNSELLETIYRYFEVTLPFIPLTTYYGASLNTLTDEVMIIDPFTKDISSEVKDIMLDAGFTTTNELDEYGFLTFEKDHGYIRCGYYQGYGFALYIGSSVIPPTISVWEDDLVNLLISMYGESIPVAPVTASYDQGIGTNGDVYISDFRCGDITSQYVDILENAGYEYIREEFDGFARYDGDNLSIFIQYFADTDVFEIWVSFKPTPISSWNDELEELMLFRLGDIIPVAPIYNDFFSGWNASLGCVFIMDSSSLDVSQEYDVILRQNGYLPLNESNLAAGYLNETTGILIKYKYYTSDAEFEIFASPYNGPRTISSWDPIFRTEMIDVLGETIPVAPMTNFYFAFDDYDYTTYNPYVLAFDTYCGDISSQYQTVLQSSDYHQLSTSEGQSFLKTNYPTAHYMIANSEINYQFYNNDSILIVYGYDDGGEWLGSPAFVILAFSLNPTPVENGGGIVII